MSRWRGEGGGWGQGPDGDGKTLVGGGDGMDALLGLSAFWHAGRTAGPGGGRIHLGWGTGF